jgi:tetratricopeptide (TPR) repeat protein
LFVEEMLALAHEGGDLRAPSTIHALIQARLDRLGAPERSVIERGAVEGEIFHRAPVSQLVNGSDNGIDFELAGLVRKELIRPERTIFPGDDAYRFRHLLIRDAAYDALPKETRADLHLRFADWLSEHGELVELDEIVGYHLEQAARYRGELGNADGTIEARAAERLAAAGSKALARGDLSAANNLFSRALRLLPAGDARRTPILIELLAVLETHGTIAERSPLIEELEQHDDPVARMHGRLERLSVRISNNPNDVIEETKHVAHEAIELFEAAGDEGGVAHAWYALFWTDWLQSRGAPALESLERALEHAERAGASALTASGIVYLMGPLVHGPLTPAEIRARIERLRGGGVIATHSVLRVEAHLLQLEGRFDEALVVHGRADELARDLGMVMIGAIARQWSAEIVAKQGRLEEALALMQQSSGELGEMGQTSFRSTTLVQIALLEYDLGDLDEAERVAVEGEELGSEDDFVNFALGRAVRARIAADRGRQDAARKLIESALEYAYETDFPFAHAAAHKAHAHVLSAAGHPDEARAALERAVELYESVGNVFEARRTQELLVEL